MFWIGMIVGVIAAFFGFFAYLAYCCKVNQIDGNAFLEITGTIETAIANRKRNQIRVWHDDKLLDVTMLEEN